MLANNYMMIKKEIIEFSRLNNNTFLVIYLLLVFILLDYNPIKNKEIKIDDSKRWNPDTGYRMTSWDFLQLHKSRGPTNRRMT